MVAIMILLLPLLIFFLLLPHEGVVLQNVIFFLTPLGLILSLSTFIMNIALKKVSSVIFCSFFLDKCIYYKILLHVVTIDVLKFNFHHKKQTYNNKNTVQIIVCKRSFEFQ